MTQIAPVEESSPAQPNPPKETLGQRAWRFFRMEPNHSVFTDEKVLNRSLGVLQWACFIDQCVGSILQPNFPFLAMTKPDFDIKYSDESFDNVYMSYTSALYVLTGSAGIGVAFASLFFGSLSDKLGRKFCILMCMYVGAVLTVVKYLCRHDFWLFNIANFLNGLFGASTVVATSYIADIYSDDKDKLNEAMGGVMGLAMLGGNAGNILAIAMENAGLFIPLLPGAALSASAGLLIQLYLVEPDGKLHDDHAAHVEEAHDDQIDSKAAAAAGTAAEAAEAGAAEKATVAEEEDDSNPWKPPTKMNWKLLSVIILGSILDNIGSMGPLMAMSPLMLYEYNYDYLLEGEKPLLSATSHKWISTMIMIAIIPGVIVSTPIYQKIGVATGCVLGNFITMVQTIIFIAIAYSMKPSQLSLGLFVTVLYGVYPFSVLSQLTTGPMIEAIAPEHQKGLAQGLNNGVMNFVMAVAPIILGLIKENLVLMQTCVIFCVLAMAANAPLMRYPQLMWSSDPNAPLHTDHEEDMATDEELIKRAEAGEWIPAKELDRINMDRFNKGEKFLRIPYGSYAKDAPFLGKLRKRARTDFMFFKEETEQWIDQMKEPAAREAAIKSLKESRPPQDYVDHQKKELGEWFADYLTDNGYMVENDPTPFKMMIMNAFPPLPKDPTADTLVLFMTKTLKVMNTHIQLGEAEKSSLSLLSQTAPHLGTKLAAGRNKSKAE